jgi:hypothetical protein
MSSLDPASRSLVDAARGARPSRAARERINDGLASKLGASALGGAALASRSAGLPLSTPPAALAAGGSLAKTVGAALVVLSAAGAGGYALKSRVRADRTEAMAPARANASAMPIAAHASHRADLPIASATSVGESAPSTPPGADDEREAAARSAPTSLPDATSNAQAKVATTSVAPISKDPPGGGYRGASRADDGEASIRSRSLDEGADPARDAIAEEVASLRQAKLALDDGEGERALAALDELAARHPEGALREERLAAHVLALCAAGRTGDAAREARAFLAEMPGSIHAERLRASCAFAESEEGKP